MIRPSLDGWVLLVAGLAVSAWAVARGVSSYVPLAPLLFADLVYVWATARRP